ncbi:MAG: hypothetical protein WC130_11670 [Kiritimatiellia bacterium]
MAAGIGDLRGGNDLAALRDEWTKRPAAELARSRQQELLDTARETITDPREWAVFLSDPEAWAKSSAKRYEPQVAARGSSIWADGKFNTAPIIDVVDDRMVTGTIGADGAPVVNYSDPRGPTFAEETARLTATKPEVITAPTTSNVLTVDPRGGGPSLGERNNNPGNLEDGEFARSQPGYVGTDGRFARFATPEAGAKAQETLLANAYIGRGQNTIQSIIEGVPGEGGRRVHGYSPRQSDGGDNTDEQVNNYIGYVARRAGVDPTAPIPPDRVSAVAAAMREFETGQRPGGQGGGTRVVQQGVEKPTGFRPISDAERQTWGIPAGIPAKINMATGEPEIISGAAGALPKPPPRLVVQGYGANQAAVGKIKTALSLLGRSPGSVGMIRGLGDTINQRLDPEGVAARAAIMDISGQIMSDRSGAAVPAAEMTRLQPYLPNITDTTETVKTKLNGLLREIENVNAQMQYDYPTLGQPGAGEAGGADVADQIANGEVPTAPSTGGGRRSATAGAPRTSKPPIQVRSLQEAESLPEGTVFVFNGRRGVVR